MLTEAEIETILMGQLQSLGYTCLNDAVSGPDGPSPEREAYSDTILSCRLRAAIARLNPHIPEDAREGALRRIVASDRPSLIEENCRLHRFMVEGVPVEYRTEDGSIRGDAVRLVDAADALNDWLAIAQFTVIENGNNRRPDVVVFLNGLPIYYESRLARIELPDTEKPKVDAEIEDLTEDEAVSEQERLKRKWSTVEALVGSEKRLAMVAADLVAHFEARVEAMDGKAMVVCMSRRICVDLYDQIVALRPDWHSDDDAAGAVKIVMTGSAADPAAWQPHIGGKAQRDLLAKRAKDPGDPLKLVIVRDMWLTGFDAPSMHTMYIDKPMRGHGLMQAIARVNRVFRDKPAGLIVDYIGIAQNLKAALGQYSNADQDQAGIDEAEAVAALLERLDVVRAMFHGLDYSNGLTGTPQQRLVTLAEALDWILAKQDEAAQRETDKEAKKVVHRRFQDAVLALSKAFALSSASDTAREVRDEVGFFQTLRAAMVKAADTLGRSAADRDLAIRQIVNDAVASTEIVDILSAAGLSSPDISILSDEFLAKVGQMEKKNLALEALRKLLNDEIRSRSQSNVIETRKFSERLEEAIARYHTNAISTVEVLQELIALAKEVRDARNRGEETGLTPEEIAFYDTLADNQSAVDILGNDQMKIIAHELLNGIKANVSIDWAHRDSARARLRVLVKRILRKYGYPPDLEDAAVRGVLAQAEAMMSEGVG